LFINLLLSSLSESTSGGFKAPALQSFENLLQTGLDMLPGRRQHLGKTDLINDFSSFSQYLKQ